MNRKKTITILTAIVLLCLTVMTFAGCEQRDARKKAEAYVSQYESEFAQAVEHEFGQDWSLTDVSGSVYSWVSDYHIFTQYDAKNKLYGMIEHNGSKYHAVYDFDTKTLETDVYMNEILDSLVETLGMDSSKVTYSMAYNYVNVNVYGNPSTYGTFESNVHTIEDALKTKKGIEFYIITSEDMEGLDIDSYAKLCKDNKKIFNVSILCSDVFTGLDHFKKHCYDIDINYAHPMVPETDDVNSSKVDVFTKYNLKEFVRIQQTTHNEEEYNIEALRFK